MGDICCLYYFLKHLLNIRYCLDSGEVNRNKRGFLLSELGGVIGKKALC